METKRNGLENENPYNNGYLRNSLLHDMHQSFTLAHTIHDWKCLYVYIYGLIFLYTLQQNIYIGILYITNNKKK